MFMKNLHILRTCLTLTPTYRDGDIGTRTQVRDEAIKKSKNMKNTENKIQQKHYVTRRANTQMTHFKVQK